MGTRCASGVKSYILRILDGKGGDYPGVYASGKCDGHVFPSEEPLCCRVQCAGHAFGQFGHMWQISMPRLNLTGLEYPLINKFVSISYVISTDLTIKIYISDTWKA